MLLRQASDSRFQIDALDGLRGLAVLIVVASHTSNIHWYFLPTLDLRGIGKAGVYLFFLLSAFLLTLPLLDKGRAMLSNAVLWHYLQRRFFRIYPIYILYLLFAATTTVLIHRTLGPEEKGIPFSLNLVEFIQHVLLIDCKGVTWSIAAEFKFYFALPLLAFALWWLREKHIALALAFVAAVIATQLLLQPYFPFLANYQSFWLYLPIFMLGMGLALLQKDIFRKGGLKPGIKLGAKVLAGLGFVGLVLMTPLGMSLLGIDVDKEYFHNFYCCYGLAWATLLFATVNTNGLLQKFFSSSLLRFFGAISFSLYLFHPIPIFILQLLHIETPFNAWIVLATASAAAYLSSRYLEYPLSKIRI